MKNDSLSLSAAVVNRENAVVDRHIELGIDFTNEIDVWAQMEFQARRQITHLRQFGAFRRRSPLRSLSPFVYSTRQSLEE